MTEDVKPVVLNKAESQKFFPEKSCLLLKCLLLKYLPSRTVLAITLWFNSPSTFSSSHGIKNVSTSEKQNKKVRYMYFTSNKRRIYLGMDKKNLKETT